MANLFSQDITNAANRYFCWGHDPHFYDLYLQKYAALNPVFPQSMTYPVCTPFTSGDIIPFEEMRETQYHKGWLEPQGYIDFRRLQSRKDRRLGSSELRSSGISAKALSMPLRGSAWVSLRRICAVPC